jgi:hypothetical protein
MIVRRWALVMVWCVCTMGARAMAQDLTPDERFADQILDAGLASNEHEHELAAKPEIFVQTRFSRAPTTGIDPDDAERNFQVTRLETRWAGRLSDRIGAGLELQWHPAALGAAEELVNDAFVEFYATKNLTIRAGQFIKPFGFDIQRSSADREYPERGMFAGYFFPGQRDRGIMAVWDLQAASPAVGHTQLYGALLNGNRFFADNDDRLDTVLRIRRLLPKAGLAIGASAQFGSQIVPPTVSDDGDVRIVGVDAQYVIDRIGIRAEWVRGTRPSTLLSREPEFTDAFMPGAITSGFAASVIVRASTADQVYARFDQLTGDPMNAERVRGWDVGYRRSFSESAHMSLNYQGKNGPTRNDDAVNTHVQVTLGLTF